MANPSLELGTLILTAISTSAAVVALVQSKRAGEKARAANRVAEAAVRFQVLLPALFEYRSADMFIAVRALWDFWRAHPSNIKQAYIAQWERDSSRLRSLQGDDHLKFLRGTIDFHRRHVSQFYSFLTSVYDEGGDQRKWIYTHWGRADLEIIPNVIVPMETALREVVGSVASPKTLNRLLRLYEDSPL
jgi:hypothetical protein